MNSEPKSEDDQPKSQPSTDEPSPSEKGTSVSRDKKARLERLRQRSSAYSLHALTQKTSASSPVIQEPSSPETIVLDDLPKASEVQSIPAVFDAPALALPQPRTEPLPPAPTSKKTPWIVAGIASLVAVLSLVFWIVHTKHEPTSSLPPSTSSSAGVAQQETLSESPISSASVEEPSAASEALPTEPSTRPVAKTHGVSTTAAFAKAAASAEPTASAGPPEQAEESIQEPESLGSSESTETIPLPPPPPPPHPCGCKPDDLKCNIDCAVKGK